MPKIEFCICDDRLIHGQMIFKWLSEINTEEILILDDDIQRDSIEKMLIKMIVPENIKLDILDVSNFLKNIYLDEDKYNNKLILLKKINTLNQLHKSGISIKEINLVRVPSNIGRIKIAQNIYLDINEKKLLIDLIKEGSLLYSQLIPSSKKRFLSKGELN